MVQKTPLDDTARKRIADVFARLPPTETGSADADPPHPSVEIALTSTSDPEKTVSTLHDDPALLRVIEAARRPGWRGWMIRKLAGL